MSHPWWPQPKYLYRPMRAQAPVLPPLGLGFYDAASPDLYRGIYGPRVRRFAHHGYALPPYVAAEPTGLGSCGYYECGVGFGAEPAQQQQCMPASEAAKTLKSVLVQVAEGLGSAGCKELDLAFTTVNLCVADVVKKVPESAFQAVVEEISAAARGGRSKLRAAIDKAVRVIASKSGIPGASEAAGMFSGQIADKAVDAILGSNLKNAICPPAPSEPLDPCQLAEAGWVVEPVKSALKLQCAGGATGTKQLMTWEQLRQYQKANQLTFTPGAQPINTPFYLQPQQATAATAVPAASGTGKTALLVAAIAGAAFFLLR
jgi:hypothetical protein